MFIKLDERCKIFSIHGINMVGCPITKIVFGLTDAGYKFVMKIKNGAEISTKDLSEEIKELYEEMNESGFFSKKVISRDDKSAYLHVTSRCNMKCNGCYSKSNVVCNKYEMKTKEIYQVVDNMVRAGFQKIVISGGEPFIREDILDIIKYIKNKECMVYAITNGTMEIQKYKEALNYLDDLSFSMDSYSEETSVLRKNSFKKIENALEELKYYKEKMSIIFTLHNKNIHLYESMKKYAYEKGVNHNFSLFSAKINESTEEFIIPQEKLLEFFYKMDEEDKNIDTFSEGEVPLSCKTCCGAGKTRISISSEGKIYPCHMMQEKSFLLGDALHDAIGDVIKGLEEGYITVDKKRECKKCEYAYLCGGGCLYRAYIERENIEDKDRLCEIYKKRIDDALRPFL